MANCFEPVQQLPLVITATYITLVPTVSVGIHTGTLQRSVTLERHLLHSHAEHGNDKLVAVFWGAGFNLHSLEQEQAKACAPIIGR